MTEPEIEVGPKLLQIQVRQLWADVAKYMGGADKDPMRDTSEAQQHDFKVEEQQESRAWVDHVLDVTQVTWKFSMEECLLVGRKDQVLKHARWTLGIPPRCRFVRGKRPTV